MFVKIHKTNNHLVLRDRVSTSMVGKISSLTSGNCRKRRNAVESLTAILNRSQNSAVRSNLAQVLKIILNRAKLRARTTTQARKTRTSSRRKTRSQPQSLPAVQIVWKLWSHRLICPASTLALMTILRLKICLKMIRRMILTALSLSANNYSWNLTIWTRVSILRINRQKWRKKNCKWRRSWIARRS